VIVVPLARFCIVLILICIVLLCVAVGRLSRTPRKHPERRARIDTVRLFAVVLGALGLALARTQFLSTSPLFVGLSVALMPFGLYAFWLMFRLIGVYRQDKVGPQDTMRPDVQALQSRISSPLDGKKP